VAQGVHGRRRAGSGDAFWQYRRAQPGDGAASIDWRRSARSDHLFVRETEWAASQTVWLWLDGSPSMHWRSDTSLPTKHDRARLLVLALASLLLKGGERVASLTGDTAPCWGSGALGRLALALERAADAPLSPPARLPRRALPAGPGADGGGAVMIVLSVIPSAGEGSPPAPLMPDRKSRIRMRSLLPLVVGMTVPGSRAP
jgi:uncharacterized protein (DUF58 family)